MIIGWIPTFTDIKLVARNLCMHNSDHLLYQFAVIYLYMR